MTRVLLLRRTLQSIAILAFKGSISQAASEVRRLIDRSM